MGHLGLGAPLGRRDDQFCTMQGTALDLAASSMGDYHSFLSQMIHFVIYHVPYTCVVYMLIFLFWILKLYAH